eukprot:6648454-Pyramimonas_sp.AAC.1
MLWVLDHLHLPDFCTSGELTAVDCFFVIAPVVSVHSPFHPLLQEHRRSAADLPAVCMGDYISR